MMAIWFLYLLESLAFSSAMFSRGNHTLTVPLKLFGQNRERLCANLRKSISLNGVAVLLQGGSETTRYHTDADDLPFRQESSFYWTFGVLEPDFYGVIDVKTGKSLLFVPKIDPSYVIWFGKIYDNSYWKKRYEVDEVHYTDDISSVLKDNLNVTKLLLLKGQNTDSKKWFEPASFPGIENFQLDLETLYPILVECRVHKTDLELSVIRYACKVSSDAHKATMKTVRPNMYEYQLESSFRHYTYFTGGCRYLGYTAISASGPNCAILHYGHAAAPNDRQVKSGDLCLMDMGAEYFCYTADITTTFPVNGKFTDQQKLIYNAVLKANRAVFAAVKPSVSWVDMHYLAERTLLSELKTGGLLVGDVDDMMKTRLGAVFMPHGLGHFMGLDVHDVGGYPKGTERINEPGLSSLRTTRILEPRMVITVEPGCYFIDPLLDKALGNTEQAKFMVKDEIDKFRGFGGVRIEDDIVITENGAENMVDVPRTVEEIESFMAR